MKIAISFALACAATIVVLVFACLSRFDLLTPKEMASWAAIVTPVAFIVSLISLRRMRISL